MGVNIPRAEVCSELESLMGEASPSVCGTETLDGEMIREETLSRAVKTEPKEKTALLKCLGLLRAWLWG